MLNTKKKHKTILKFKKILKLNFFKKLELVIESLCDGFNRIYKKLFLIKKNQDKKNTKKKGKI